MTSTPSRVPAAWGASVLTAGRARPEGLRTPPGTAPGPVRGSLKRSRICARSRTSTSSRSSRGAHPGRGRRRHDVFISLAGGLARSETIRYYPPSRSEDLPACLRDRTKRCYDCSRPWLISNDIDDTRQQLSDKGLWTANHIGEALDKGALYLDSTLVLAGAPSGSARRDRPSRPEEPCTSGA